MGGGEGKTKKAKKKKNPETERHWLSSTIYSEYPLGRLHKKGQVRILAQGFRDCAGRFVSAPALTPAPTTWPPLQASIPSSSPPLSLLFCLGHPLVRSPACPEDSNTCVGNALPGQYYHAALVEIRSGGWAVTQPAQSASYPGLSHDKGAVRRRDRRETARANKAGIVTRPVQLFVENGELNRHDCCCRGASGDGADSSQTVLHLLTASSRELISGVLSFLFALACPALGRLVGPHLSTGGPGEHSLHAI